MHPYIARVGPGDVRVRLDNPQTILERPFIRIPGIVYLFTVID
ncbi:hypothetical protein LX16_2192 [Stackebrandtia albiflava]|uniref:Uncharacterized protein n=1 Tax=Stackebrandtia albiflava TaxID=406432 RepID=A0A562V0L4_9ACTN|nr:hypothetical protein LX16_2192 [Stackebrandtia albiflava]